MTKTVFTLMLTGLFLMATEARAMDSHAASASVPQQCQQDIDLCIQAQIIAAGLSNERLSPKKKVLTIVTMEGHKTTLGKIKNSGVQTAEHLEMLRTIHTVVSELKAGLEAVDELDRAEKARVQQSKKCAIL